mmetsp:Transcript_23576/g.74255  ORF Transcript_23576/g.74255 Transcript_23576/m.74255 type:complete len:311 (-) Transcript_23576:263-1195(-)
MRLVKGGRDQMIASGEGNVLIQLRQHNRGKRALLRVRLRGPRNGHGGKVREQRLHTLKDGQDHLSREGRRQLQCSRALQAVEQAHGQSGHTPELLVIGPHHGEGVYGPLLLDRQRGVVHGVHRARRPLVDPLRGVLEEVLAILDGCREPVDDKTEGQNLLHEVLQAARRLRAHRRRRVRGRVGDAEAAARGEDRKLQGFEARPLRSASHVAVAGAARGELNLHLIPDLGQKVPRRHAQALTDHHEDQRHALLFHGSLGGGGGEERPPQHPPAVDPRLPRRGRSATRRRLCGGVRANLLADLQADHVAGIR